MLASGQIKVSPAYQRKFRWKEKQCSQFIESMMPGDSDTKVVDGKQISIVLGKR